MTTTTLSSKNRFTNLLKVQLLRNLSTMAYLTVILFLFFPLQLFLQWQQLENIYQSNGHIQWWRFVSPTNMYTTTSFVAVCFILIVGTLVISLSQVSYMHQKRSVDLYHSLPLTRRQLMLANGITAFATVAIPFVVNYVINIAFALVCTTLPGYSFLWTNVLRDIFGWLVAIMGIISVVFFVATQVGSSFENFVFSCEILVTPFALLGINEAICSWHLLGYSSKLNIYKVCNLTPATFMISANTSPNYSNTSPASWFPILIWFLLGISLFVASMLLYERRKSEKAESTGCQGILGFLLICIGTYIGAFLMGAFISAITTETPVNYMIGCLIGTVLVFILIQAILNRGFSGMLSHLRMGALICAVVIIAQAIPSIGGGFGYVHRVPAPEKVSSVEVGGRGWFSNVNVIDAESVTEGATAIPEYAPTLYYNYDYLRSVTLTEQDSIAAVQNLHRTIIDESKNSRARYGTRYSFAYQVNRHTLERKYYLPTLTTQDEAIEQLWICREFVEKTHPVFHLTAEQINKIDLHDNFGFYRTSVNDREQLSYLLQALREDAILDRTQSYFSDAPILCIINIQTDFSDSRSDPLATRPTQDRVAGTVTLPVFATDKAFARALESMGLSEQMKPFSASEITSIGVNRYFKESGEQFLPVISRYMDLQGANYNQNEATLSLPQTIAKIEEVGKRFAYYDASRYEDFIYCTFYKDKEAGITVQLPVETFYNSLSQEEITNLNNLLGDTTYGTVMAEEAK